MQRRVCPLLAWMHAGDDGPIATYGNYAAGSVVWTLILESADHLFGSQYLACSRWFAGLGNAGRGGAGRGRYGKGHISESE